VLPDDIDEQNHVNNVVYLRWVQKLPYAHWINPWVQELIKSYRWVVLRHEIDYQLTGLADRTIEASTWMIFRKAQGKNALFRSGAKATIKRSHQLRPPGVAGCLDRTPKACDRGNYFRVWIKKLSVNLR